MILKSIAHVEETLAAKLNVWRHIVRKVLPQMIDLFTGDARTPGRRRRVEVSAPADLCLLTLDTASALEDLSAANVRMTIIDGDVVYDR